MRETANGRSHPGSAEMHGDDRPQDGSEHGTAQYAELTFHYKSFVPREEFHI